MIKLEILYILIFLVSLALIFLLLLKDVTFGSKRDSEPNINQIREFVRSQIKDLRLANSSFYSLLYLQRGYFRHSEMIEWKEKYSKLFDDITLKPFQNVGLEGFEEKAIMVFLDFFANAESLRKNFNKNFVHAELEKYNFFFDNIEGKSLDDQQRKAIVGD